LSRYLGKAGDTVVLSTEGREYYESGFGSNIGTVFIIAACSPPPAEASFKEQHDAVLSVYKRAVDDAGYRPIFQEHEEPRKNIYVDVFDYLDTCEFVVADVTWERPNCYVEIGYALAARKQVLLFVEESYLSRMERQQMPFDLAPIKYLSYRRDVEGQKELRRQIDQRITVVKQRRLADG
jgi:nucleoside 2-deoxyribosyltransferase